MDIHFDDGIFLIYLKINKAYIYSCLVILSERKKTSYFDSSVLIHMSAMEEKYVDS